MPSDGKSSHCLWQGELKNDKIQNVVPKAYKGPNEALHVLRQLLDLDIYVLVFVI